MSFVRTLVLLAVALGLGAWLYFVEEPAALKALRADILLDIDPADVEKLRLAYPEGSEIVAVRDGENWKLTSPLQYPAEASVVVNFLTTIKDTKIERRIKKEEAGALATYGLEGDTGKQARLEVTTSGGKAEPAIVLGISTPVGYQAFARREGSDEVLVIPLLLQSSARKTPFELRKKTMFEGADSTGIKHVTIDKPGEKIEIERKAETIWALDSPMKDAADTESVRSMLDSIATIDAVAFFDGDQVDRKAFGLDEGATHFRAVKEDGSAIEFTIGKEASDQPAGNYAERGNDQQVFKAPDWVAQKFVPATGELREKRLLACKLDEIRSMTWQAESGTFTISREAAGKPWSISPENPDEVLNQAVVDNATNGLALARADKIAGDALSDADLQRYGLDAPVVRLEIAGDKGQCAALSAVPTPASAAPIDGQRPGAITYYVKNAGRSAVMIASEHEFSRLAMKRAEFVDAAPKGAAPVEAPKDAAAERPKDPATADLPAGDASEPD